MLKIINIIRLFNSKFLSFQKNNELKRKVNELQQSLTQEQQQSLTQEQQQSQQQSLTQEQELQRAIDSGNVPSGL